MAAGRIIRAIAGFFYVEDLEVPGVVRECSVRGRLRFNETGRGEEHLLVGDLVEYRPEREKGVITAVRDRFSVLKRPYIANVDLLILVFAHRKPDPNDVLITRFLVLAEASGIPFILVFNKTDLVEKGKAHQFANKYLNYGYHVICTSVPDHLGQNELGQVLSGKIAVFAGPSGVGKSALFNFVAPQSEQRTGAVSLKIGRGRHTTREVQLIKLKNQAYLADTPGFSQVSLDSMEPARLAWHFREFVPYLNSCRFTSCLHAAEPDCGIKTAMQQGNITEERYLIYLELLKEVKQQWDNRFR